MGASTELIDAYAVLGVDPSATQAELKAAHRRLVRRHHPDLVPPPERKEATRRVQRINVAYGLVRDEPSRDDYDRLRAAQRRRAAASATDAELARRWETLLRQAGRWAGTWWARHRRAVGRSAVRAALAAQHAGREALAGVLWLASCVVGALAGAVLTLLAGQAALGEVGALAPVAGTLSGWWVGSDRGRRRRRRMARLPPPARSPALTPALALAAVAAALGIDGLLMG